MRKLWSERIAEKAEKRGIKLGERQGIKLGERKGIKLGESLAKRQTLLAQMRAKFGPLPRGAARQVSAIATPRRLDTLLRRVLTAETLSDMGLR
ncbi:MAG: hypothetical protein HYZ53_16190 [Planctomycetes bacterium]|nr:hypothetical protein [Planctomycetota bacterium]